MKIQKILKIIDMEMDNYGSINWVKTDFKKHGTIAKYLIGECRCKKCKARILAKDPERHLPSRYNIQ